MHKSRSIKCVEGNGVGCDESLEINHPVFLILNKVFIATYALSLDLSHICIVDSIVSNRR